MEISFTKLARDYVDRENVDEVYAYMDFSIGCTITFRPLVKEGMPTDPEEYVKHDVDGITVYYHKELNQDKYFLIGYQKVGKRELLVPGEDRD